MKISENAINILTAKTYNGIGRAWVVKNLYGAETVDQIVSLLRRDSKDKEDITIDGFEATKARIEDDVRKLEGFADGVVGRGDHDFPQYRGMVKNSEVPIVLFYRGDLSLLNLTNLNIAVIGLLNPDEDIIQREKEVVEELVGNGATIVSGLALGCDSVAHREALRLQGKTVAILPSPLNDILPATNKALAEEIVKNEGLLLTEYHKEARSRMEFGGRYQERDRLQALFSDGIVLSASYAKNNLGNDSGSRLAMGYALNYSIPRAVMYEADQDANNPRFDLNRQLMDNTKNVAIINRKNLGPAVKRFISLGPKTGSGSASQLDLFNTL